MLVLAIKSKHVISTCVAGRDFYSGPMTQAIVDGLGGVLFRFPFRVPAYYALILRSLTVLEGLALQADSNYKLLGKAYPYMARRLLTDPAPELRWVFAFFSSFRVQLTCCYCK